MLIGNLNFLTLLTVAFLIVTGFFAGFFLFAARNTKLKKRVLELEHEMITNHAEILRLLQGTKEQPAAHRVNNAPVITLSANNARAKEK